LNDPMGIRIWRGGLSNDGGRCDRRVFLETTGDCSHGENQCNSAGGFATHHLDSLSSPFAPRE
jgi:hypothetical protein